LKLEIWSKELKREPRPIKVSKGIWAGITEASRRSNPPKTILTRTQLQTSNKLIIITMVVKLNQTTIYLLTPNENSSRPKHHINKNSLSNSWMTPKISGRTKERNTKSFLKS